MKKSQPGDRELLADVNACPVDREAAMMSLLSDKEPGLEALIAPLLRHENLALRTSAIIAILGRLGLDEYFQMVMGFLAGDEESGVRTAAAKSLEMFVTYTGRAREEALRELLRVFLTADDRWVQMSTYDAVVRIVKGTWSSTLKEVFSLKTDVDWQVLRSAAAEVGLTELLEAVAKREGIVE
jgi:hypothetical protein